MAPAPAPGGDALAAEYALFADWAAALTRWHLRGGAKSPADRDTLLRDLLRRLFPAHKALGPDNPYMRALSQSRTHPPADAASVEQGFQKWLRTAVSAVYDRTPEPWDHTHARYDFLQPPLLPDEMGRVGPFGVRRVLGAGGMGVVFEAYFLTAFHERNGFALKTVKTQDIDAELTARIKRETEILARLNGTPNVVQFVTSHAEGGRLYYAMEHVFGPTLHDLIDLHGDRPVPVPLAVALLHQIATGLVAAHSFKPPIIHRDLKPSNVFLQRETDREDNSCGWRVRVGDFGLAGLADLSGITASGDILGTDGYRAPEQFAGKAFPTTDVYALGVIAFRILTGTPLREYEGCEPADRRCALSETSRSPALTALVLDMLHGQYDRRPSSAEIRDRLATVRSEIGPRPLVERPAVGIARSSTASRVTPKRDQDPAAALIAYKRQLDLNWRGRDEFGYVERNAGGVPVGQWVELDGSPPGFSLTPPTPTDRRAVFLLGQPFWVADPTSPDDGWAMAAHEAEPSDAPIPNGYAAVTPPAEAAGYLPGQWVRITRADLLAAAMGKFDWRHVGLVCGAGLGKTTSLRWLEAAFHRRDRYAGEYLAFYLRLEDFPADQAELLVPASPMLPAMRRV